MAEQIVTRQESNREYQRRYLSKPENRAKKRARNLTTKQKRKARGLCVNCGQRPALENRSYCSECKSLMVVNAQKRRAECVAQGRCWQCRKASILPNHNRLCETCYFRVTAKQRLGGFKYWQVLKAKFDEQRGRCAYTGIPLILGVNASLDHIMPSLHYPHLRRDPNNIEWVSRAVNEMKRDRTPDEFLSLIKSIFHYRS